MNIAGSGRFAWTLAPLLLVACASLSVTSQQYPEADFSGYHTYAWISGDPLIRPRGAAPEVSALTVRRIREAVEAELAAKGYQAAAAPSAAILARFPSRKP